MIFDEIFSDSLVIIKDVFGNFVVQKILEFGPKDHKIRLFEAAKGSILELSKHYYGCRVVQRFIDELDQEQKDEIVQEIKENIVD